MKNQKLINITDIKIIIGLGNPGKNYENTYHNIGIIFLDTIISGPWKRIAGKHFVYKMNNGIIFVKPILFMNENGMAVNEALTYFKILPSELLVVHDDSDIHWSDYKIDFNKGSAGHKGVQSIINELGTKGFWRLRLGIREKINITPKKDGLPPKQVKAIDFVLNKLKSKHASGLLKLFTDIYKDLTFLPQQNKSNSAE